MDKVVHFEIPVDDVERARKFYGSIFGWGLKDWPMPDGSNYIAIWTTPVDEKTRIPKEPGAINVSSVDEYVKKIIAAGGKVVMPKMEIGGMGYYAYIADTEGNVIGLWEDMKKG